MARDLPFIVTRLQDLRSVARISERARDIPIF